MGRVKNTSDVNNNNASTMKHISHPHELELCNSMNLDPNATVCAGCKLQPSGNMFICRPCNFILHSTCAKFPPLITHPSHLGHTLSLLLTPSYPSGKFDCNACNHQGDGFSYHCKECDFDLHVVCASKPLKISHQLHPCKLELTFQNPYENSKEFSCDVCSKMGSKQWLYRCNGCEFDVHLGCASATGGTRSTIQAPVTIQHQNSFPGATLHSHGVGFVRPMQHMHSASIGSSSMYQNQFQAPINTFPGVGTVNPIRHMHSASLGTSSIYQNQFQAPINASVGPVLQMHSASMGASPRFQNQFQGPVAAGQVYGSVMPNQFMHSASTESMLNYQPPVMVMTLQNNQGSRTDDLMNAAMQGFVEGAAQQAGTSLMQGIIGGVFGDSSDGQNH